MRPAMAPPPGCQQLRAKRQIKNEIADWTPAWDLFPGEITYVWHGALSIVAESLAKSRFAIRTPIIWAKARLVIRATTTGSTSPVYAVRKKGYWPTTASKPRFGPFRPAGRTPKQNSDPKAG
jgi:hypothetical protein